MAVQHDKKSSGKKRVGDNNSCRETQEIGRQHQAIQKKSEKKNTQPSIESGLWKAEKKVSRFQTHSS